MFNSVRARFKVRARIKVRDRVRWLGLAGLVWYITLPVRELVPWL